VTATGPLRRSMQCVATHDIGVPFSQRSGGILAREVLMSCKYYWARKSIDEEKGKI
jgi:hypothetical protein